MNTERQRLTEQQQGRANWRLWGPYLSDRQWGTVREDYSADGNAWGYFPHDHARSRAYRWGEDGLGGISDNRCLLCFGLALWNTRDPILKERLFGLTGPEGNHGEDVKELYYHLDATPTHSYLKLLYKYPQREFPYAALVAESQRRDKSLPEYELLDTGIFDDDRYWDIFLEYGKASPADIAIRITFFNRGPEPAKLHVLPQIWFRNTWSWSAEAASRPQLERSGNEGFRVTHPLLGRYFLEADPRYPCEFLVTDNHTNPQRHAGTKLTTGYYKDAFHQAVVQGLGSAVNPAGQGTKGALHYQFQVGAGQSGEIVLRLWHVDEPPSSTAVGVSPGSDLPWQVSLRGPAANRTQLETCRQEADAYYGELQTEIADEDARLIQRQALAGLIWNKQYYALDVRQWLRGDEGAGSPAPVRHVTRNQEWLHLNNADIISMPDKWEYPWYAAWDLAFHCLPFAVIDPEFAKEQLLLLTREWYMHPNGQLPAYEWAFSDANPPVHAWAAWRVFQIDRRDRGDAGDLAFLERVFHKLLLNFTWWVNRKDVHGRNVFQGGFLGLDNIGVFDRSAPLPTGGVINQADGTSWMAMYSLNMMRIAIELAMHNPVYEDIAMKFFEHFLSIAEAMTHIGGTTEGIGLWDEEDKFYYDELNLPSGEIIKLRVRSMVGLIPLFAVETLEPEMLSCLPNFSQRLEWILQNRPELAQLVSRWQEPGRGERRLLSLLRGHRMKRLLVRMLDESEFLSDYGVRALSRYHREHPYTFWCNGTPLTVKYQPAESDTRMFGGNSNWRGPIWFPVNYLIIESLQKFHHYYTDDFRIECPTGSGNFLTIQGVADELTRRLSRLFLRNEQGGRAVFGNHPKLNQDPHFRDYLLFYEYFHGDNGRGVGASHQTGWTGVIAKLLQPRRWRPGD